MGKDGEGMIEIFDTIDMGNGIRSLDIYIPKKVLGESIQVAVLDLPTLEGLQKCEKELAEAKEKITYLKEQINPEREGDVI